MVSTLTRCHSIDDIVDNLKLTLRCSECTDYEARQFSNKRYILVKKLFSKSNRSENSLEICYIGALFDLFRQKKNPVAHGTFIYRFIIFQITKEIEFRNSKNIFHLKIRLRQYYHRLLNSTKIK